jgi:hypothetical protein
MAEKVAAPCNGLSVAVGKNLDICVVDGNTVAFDITATLWRDVETTANVRLNGDLGAHVGTVIQEVVGNVGDGIDSLVSGIRGFVELKTGAEKVFINGREMARHLSQCLMNTDATGNTNGTKGLIYTCLGGPKGTPAPRLPCNRPLKTSLEREFLKDLKKEVGELPTGEDALEGWIERANKYWDDTIDLLHEGARPAVPSTWQQWVFAPNQSYDATVAVAGDYAQSVAAGAGYSVLRAALRTIKDLAMDLARLPVIAGPKNRMLDPINLRLLEEEMRLGNICDGELVEATKAALKDIFSSVTMPWEKGEYIEALAAAGFTFVGGVAKIPRLARAARAAKIVDSLATLSDVVSAVENQTEELVDTGAHVLPRK